MDPMESIVAQALKKVGVDFTTDQGGHNPSGLDFKLSDGVEIEVKRFHSPRIAEQMSRAENVIALQGKRAVEHYAALHQDIYDLTAEIDTLRQALAGLTDAFLSRHGCFPIDLTTPDQRQWHNAMSAAYTLVGQPNTPERNQALTGDTQ